MLSCRACRSRWCVAKLPPLRSVSLSPLSPLSLSALSLTTHTPLAAAIAPALLHSSNNGSVNTFLGPQWSTLTEAAVTASLSDCDDDTTSPTQQGRYDGLRSAAGANSSLICAVAAALAQLHALRVAEVELEATQEIGDAAPSSAAGAAPSARRYARCKPRIWTSVDVLLAIAQRHPERLPSEWDIDAVAAACARERARLDAQQLTMVTGHGDFKPSNVMVVSEDVANDTARGGGAAAIDAQIIDFELAGPNYRGFDLCKFFRRDSGPLPHASLTLFASQYLAAGKTLLGGAEAEGKAVAALVQEAREMEPLTWLEAAVFFLAFMCSGEVIHDKERYEWAAALAQQRWSRFVGLRPEEADHRPAFGGGGAPVAPSST